MNDELIKKLNYVNNSPFRRKLIKTMEGQIRTPSNLGKDIGITTSHVSKLLSEFREIEIAECINPDMRKGRLYRLTPDGEEIAGQVKAD